jgi:hypothetical protein
MMERIDTVKRYLWAFVELGFLAVLSILLVYLLLGQSSGEFVTSVAGNVSKFANEASASLIGIGVILAIVYLMNQRFGMSREPDRPKSKSIAARARGDTKVQSPKE